MPPKEKKKKKTKEELEEERRLAEEAARKAEEERLRLEEEERQRLAELERQRQELLATLQAADQDRINAELELLEPLMNQIRHERTTAATARNKDREWERFLSCTHVPRPKDRVALSDRLRLLSEDFDTQPVEALTTCQDCYDMISEGSGCMWRAHLDRDSETEALHAKDIATLHQVIGTRVDRLTADVLQHADMYANDRGEIQVGHVKDSFQWAVWVNTSKNPRLKAVEMQALSMIVEVPKQIALANIAMRVQLRSKDEYFSRCSNAFMAVGGVLYVDLLALPPPAKHVKAWTLRQITPLASNVVRIPYPIPPAGADPATYRSEEEPPPLGFTYPFPVDLALLDGDNIKVGWWDEQNSSWSQQGISDIQLDRASGGLSFRSTHIGALAVVQSRTALLPYSFWSVRPMGGKGVNMAAVTLVTPGCQDPIVIEVGSGWASIQALPCFPALATLVGQRMPPEALLQQLSAKGLHLLPENRDAQFAGVTIKDHETEVVMCYDVALLAGAFLIARSKWNQSPDAAKVDECVVRLSEVTDWEGGGRTEQRHVDRVFAKEKEEGDRRVLAVIRRGPQGVAFTDSLDKRPEYIPLTGHETVQSVQACMDTVWGESHASLVSLLWAATPEADDGILSSASSTAVVTPSRNDSTLDSLHEEDTLASLDPSANDLSGEASEKLGEDGDKGAAGSANSSMRARTRKPGLGPAGMDAALASRLSATPDGLDLVRRTDPVFTETLGHVLYLLRVFSFS